MRGLAKQQEGGIMKIEATESRPLGTGAMEQTRKEYA